MSTNETNWIATNQPIPVPGPSIPSRIAETLILGSLAAGILFVTATTEHTNGLLLDLTNQPQKIVNLSLLYLALALTGFGISILVSAAGRTSLACVLMAITLIGYGYALNGSSRMHDLQEEKRTTRSVDPVVTFNIIGVDVVGVDLWVNGVHLGKTPLEIPLSTLLDQIPDWTEPPDDQLSDAARAVNEKKIQNLTRYHFDKRWLKIQLPDPKGFLRLDENLATKLKSRESKFCYARVQLNGFDGLSAGSSGGGGDGFRYAIGLGFRFLHREQAIERLLDVARLSDYQVTKAWFDTMENFNADGWCKLREAIVLEPQMLLVLNAWANHRYGIDNASMSKQAFVVLRSIADEADQTNIYHTASVAGQAVEVLGPRIDSQLLIESACKVMDETVSISWSQFLIGEQKHWSVARDPAPISSMRATWRNSNGSGNGNPLLPSGLVIAHAVDSYLRHSGDESPQVIRIREELSRKLAQKYASKRNSAALRLAAFLQGPTVQNYIIRKAELTNWNNIGKRFEDLAEGISGGEINRWWYLALDVNSAEGRRFRNNHTDKLFEMCDKILDTIYSTHEIKTKLGFLFRDDQRDKSSFAKQYWARFRSKISEKHSQDNLSYKLTYMIAAEPVFSAKEYVDAWLDEPERYQATQALHALRTLSLTKRIEVLDLLRIIPARVNRQLPEWAHNDGDSLFNQELENAWFKEIDDQVSAAHLSERLRAEFQSNNEKVQFWKLFQDWIVEHVAERPILIQNLIEDQDGAIRKLAIEAIAQHPTPTNRGLLKRLLYDSDSSIQQAANDVQSRWENLFEN